MHRLLDIERNEGYPMCSENLSIIDENARMLELFIGNLKLPDKSAIVLSRSTAMGGGTMLVTLIQQYLFVFNGTERELLPVRGGASLLMQSPRPTIKVTLESVNQNVTNEFNHTFEDVYQQRYADLYETTDPDEAWTFYNLTDVLETGLWEPVSPAAASSWMRYVDSNDPMHIPVPLSGSAPVDWDVSKNGTKLRLKASYRFTAPTVNGQGTLYIQCRVGISTPAPVVCCYTSANGNGTITGYLSGNDIVLPMDAFTPGVEYALYFNQEILL